ncbi:MAG: hypothetical protein UV38_C0003G0068 [candidate division TM6 bacterium GW2011_GWE2_42_60]|nr:MAG: hypothetical protein UV38_C0003G0068 [candidate division TM6 bacterium GW2011_GWE2_42_60]
MKQANSSIKLDNLEKYTPVFIDREYANALSKTVSEWGSEEDEEAFKDLQSK